MPNLRKINTEWKDINKSLKKTLRTMHPEWKGLSDEDIDNKLTEEFHKPANSKEPYISYGKVKCKNGHLTSPFFFGDKRLDRGVMMECDTCGELIGFRPEDVVKLDNTQFVESDI